MNDIKPLVFKEPLAFGNKEQIEMIRRYEESLEFKAKACGECVGEGQIVCPQCNGTGLKK